MELISRPHHREAWTAEEIDVLCGFLSLRKPVREIAKHFGRSQEAISAKARKIGRSEGPTL